jgi:hypothetical protein
MLWATIHRSTDLSTHSLTLGPTLDFGCDRQDLSAALPPDSAGGAERATVRPPVVKPPRKAHGNGMTVDGRPAKGMKHKINFRFLGVYSGKIFC